MAEQGIIYQRKLWIGAYQLLYVQALRVATEVAGQDDTIMGDTGRSEAAGLEVPALEAAGLMGFDTADPDPVIATARALSEVPVTIGALAGADGERAYFFHARSAGYQVGGPVGEMARYDASARGRGHPLIPGWILRNAQVSATGNGTAYQLGAVGASQKLYGVLHVVERTGDRTLTAIIQSDISGFGTPTTRITFAQQSAIGYEYATPVAGAITDDYWRTAWTIGGTTGTITAIVAMGIR